MDIQAPKPQMIDRGTQTSSNLRLGIPEFIMKPVKSVLCHNFLWDIDEPETRDGLLNHREQFMSYAMDGTSVIGASCCGMGGCFMGHSCTVIAGEAVAGCLIGQQAGHLIEKEIATEAQRIEANQTAKSNQVVISTQIPASEHEIRRRSPQIDQ